MSKKILVALGGNAILTKDPSAQAQQKALLDTARQLVKFVEAGNEIIISHGNGPQVGNLLLQQEAGSTENNPAMPLDTVGAMTQGEIGYWMQGAISQALKEVGLERNVATVVTRTEVNADDKAFENPTKPIGPFYTEDQIEEVRKLHPDWVMVEDAGRGYRRVVASPKPTNIVESNAIKILVDNGVVTIAAGGGGVPVVKEDTTYVGREAVIDKDLSAEKLAELVNADELIILTAVDNVFVNFNKPDQKALTKTTVAELKEYIAEQQFAKGSMLPKVEAVIEFVEKTNKRAVITSLDNVANYIANDEGTIVE